MKIISWNVNSIRARVENFIEIAKEYQPDVFLLQETRVEDHAFPMEIFEDLGYNIAIKGQKSRNGVAICSKHLIEEVNSDFSEEARYIDAFTGGVFVASIYVPNGQEIDSQQYNYKLEFLRDLKEKFVQYKSELFVAGGDYNVGPYPRDIYIEGFCDVAATKKERDLIANIRQADFKDVLENQGFTWWSYRQRSFQKDNGFRIDHFYLSKKAQDSFNGGCVIRKARAFTRPSDHAPILCEINRKGLN